MTCEAVKNMMCEYLDGRLADNEQEMFNGHLSDCSSCREETEELKATLTWLKQADDVAPPQNLRRSVLDQLQKEKSEKQRRVAPGFSHAVAAAALFIMLLAGNIYSVPSPLAKSDSALLRAEEYSLQEEALPDAEMGVLTMDAARVGEDGEVGTSNTFTGSGSADDTAIVGVSTDRAAEQRRYPFRLALNLTAAPLLAVFSFLAVKKRKEAML